MTIIVAAAVWSATIGLLLFRHKGNFDHSTIWATALVGIGVGLNIGPLYLIVDGWLGGRNFGDLIANVAIILGVSSLALGVSKAADGSSFVTRVIMGSLARWMTVAVTVCAFLFIETDGSSTSFMADYGDQIAAAAYSVVQHLYFGAVMASLGVVSVKQMGATSGLVRAATGVLLAGSIVEGIACLDVIFMDIVHLLEYLNLLLLGQWVYDITNTLGFVLVTAGFVLIPTARTIDRRRTQGEVERLTLQLEDAWSRAHAMRSLGPLVEPSRDPEAALYRRIVEIMDAQTGLGDRFVLTSEEQNALEKAESILLRSDTESRSAV